MASTREDSRVSRACTESPLETKAGVSSLGVMTSESDGSTASNLESSESSQDCATGLLEMSSSRRSLKMRPARLETPMQQRKGQI